MAASTSRAPAAGPTASARTGPAAARAQRASDRPQPAPTWSQAASPRSASPSRRRTRSIAPPARAPRARAAAPARRNLARAAAASARPFSHWGSWVPRGPARRREGRRALEVGDDGREGGLALELRGTRRLRQAEHGLDVVDVRRRLLVDLGLLLPLHEVVHLLDRLDDGRAGPRRAAPAAAAAVAVAVVDEVEARVVRLVAPRAAPLGGRRLLPRAAAPRQRPNSALSGSSRAPSSNAWDASPNLSCAKRARPSRYQALGLCRLAARALRRVPRRAGRVAAPELARRAVRERADGVALRRVGARPREVLEARHGLVVVVVGALVVLPLERRRAELLGAGQRAREVRPRHALQLAPGRVQLGRRDRRHVSLLCRQPERS